VQDNLLKAIECHKSGNLEKAAKLYLESIGNSPSLIAYLNGTAVLRELGKLKDAETLIERGLRDFPKEPSLWNNQGNVLRDLGSHSGALVSYVNAIRLNPGYLESRLSLAACLRALNLHSLAYQTLLAGIAYGNEERLLPPIIEILTHPDFDSFGDTTFQSLIAHIESSKLLKQNNDTGFLISVAQLLVKAGSLDKARQWYDKAKESVKSHLANGGKLKPKFQKNWDMFSWNLAIYFLKSGDLSAGWKLYDHGLRVPAEGQQKWQRSLKKPFSREDIAIWKGEDLSGKRLLLLAEQGIGDTMMFASLIPKLEKEAARISFLCGDRLLNIYKRSFPSVDVLDLIDLGKDKYGKSAFDYQCPIGSIMQYRFNQICDYAPKTPVLKANISKRDDFFAKYYDGRPLVGISWQGGGRPNRIEKKSISLEKLLPILKDERYKFVSLQYGDDHKYLQAFNKKNQISILDDPSIDAIANMDEWLSQVACLNAVISIANTTIHGAGGLGVPTLCLLSRHSDWRWLDDPQAKTSYWYKSVNITRQHSDGSWDNAIIEAESWLSETLGIKKEEQQIQVF